MKDSFKIKALKDFSSFVNSLERDLNSKLVIRGSTLKRLCVDYENLSDLEACVRKQKENIRKKLMAFSDCNGRVIEDGWILAEQKKYFKVNKNPPLEKASRGGKRGRSNGQVYH